MRHPVYVFDYADVDFDVAATLFRKDARGIIRRATKAADDVGHELTASVGARIGGFAITRVVDIDVGEPMDVENHVVAVEVHWEAHERRHLFPTLQARLELAATARRPPMTQVTLVGDYDTPLGDVGRIGDGLLGGGRVVDATLKHFVDQVTAEIEAEAAGT